MHERYGDSADSEKTSARPGNFPDTAKLPSGFDITCLHPVGPSGRWYKAFRLPRQLLISPAMRLTIGYWHSSAMTLRRVQKTSYAARRCGAAPNRNSISSVSIV